MDTKSTSLIELTALLQELLNLLEQAPEAVSAEGKRDPVRMSPAFSKNWDEFPLTPFRANLKILQAASRGAPGTDRSSVRGALDFFYRFPRPYSDIAPSWSTLIEEIDGTVEKMHAITRKLI